MGARRLRLYTGHRLDLMDGTFLHRCTLGGCTDFVALMDRVPHPPPVLGPAGVLRALPAGLDWRA